MLTRYSQSINNIPTSSGTFWVIEINTNSGQEEIIDSQYTTNLHKTIRIFDKRKWIERCSPNSELVIDILLDKNHQLLSA